MRLNVLEFEVAALVTKDNTAGSNGHVVEGVLPVVSESWSLNSCHLQTNLQSVELE